MSKLLPKTNWHVAVRLGVAVMLCPVFIKGSPVAGISCAYAQEQKSLTELVVNTSRGRTVLHVELAITAEQRTVGLMFRRSMDRHHGMLFDFHENRMVMMWMKNTYLPLDMVFIEENGRIAHLAKDTVPHSLDIISSVEPVRYVLELNAGEAKLTGMEAGQFLQHPIFRKPGQ